VIVEKIIFDITGENLLNIRSDFLLEWIEYNIRSIVVQVLLLEGQIRRSLETAIPSLDHIGVGQFQSLIHLGFVPAQDIFVTET
jgi:hypothetical protein